MTITVAGRKMTVSDALRQYAEEKIGNAMKGMDIDPLDAEVVLHVERNRSIANYCAWEVTLFARGHVIRVEERESDMFAAIDVAAAKVLRQLRKFKTRVLDRKLHPGIDIPKDMQRTACFNIAVGILYRRRGGKVHLFPGTVYNNAPFIRS